MKEFVIYHFKYYLDNEMLITDLSLAF